MVGLLDAHVNGELNKLNKIDFEVAPQLIIAQQFRSGAPRARQAFPGPHPFPLSVLQSRPPRRGVPNRSTTSQSPGMPCFV
jgi:hypothetical protein